MKIESIMIGSYLVASIFIGRNLYNHIKNGYAYIAPGSNTSEVKKEVVADYIVMKEMAERADKKNSPVKYWLIVGSEVMALIILFSLIFYLILSMFVASVSAQPVPAQQLTESNPDPKKAPANDTSPSAGEDPKPKN